VLKHNVASLAIWLLTRKYLFIDCPSEWLSDQVLEVSHTLGVLRIIDTIVGVHYADKVFLRETLEIVEQLLDQLEILVLLVWDH
jgi:hypothetical protein